MDLNIRGVSEELRKAIGVAAAQRGMTIRDFTLLALERETAEPVRKGAVDSTPSAEARKRRGGRGVGPVPAPIKDPSKIGQPGTVITVLKKTTCPRCGKPLKPWGNGLRCEECKRNFTQGAS